MILQSIGKPVRNKMFGFWYGRPGLPGSAFGGVWLGGFLGGGPGNVIDRAHGRHSGFDSMMLLQARSTLIGGSGIMQRISEIGPLSAYRGLRQPRHVGKPEHDMRP